MDNQRFVAGMVAWCDFNKNEAKLLEKIKSRVITGLKKDENNKKRRKKIIGKINEIFDDNEVKELAQEKLGAEIGKKRPVLIIHSHERMKSAIVLPLTTLEPEEEEDKKNAIFFPKEKKPKTLRKDNSWVICDMPYHVSFRKLIKVLRCDN